MQARSVSDDATAHSHPEMTDRFRPQREEGVRTGGCSRTEPVCAWGTVSSLLPGEGRLAG